MADEIIKRDQNRVPILAGITDDASMEIRMLRVNPLTGALLVNGTGGGGGGSGSFVTRTVTNSTTATNTDHVIEADTTSNPITITLPNAATGKFYIVVWIAGANPLTITSTVPLTNFDGTTSLSVSPADLYTSYFWHKGSLRYQLV
jgi:hypothetical protein